MKKIIILIFFCLIYTFSFSQRKVKDKAKLNQLKSMEFMQWKFTPESYYYSWWKKKINLGLLGSYHIKVPGLGIHDKGPGGIGGGDKYVHNYNRNIVQTTPLIGSTFIDKDKNVIEGNMIDTIYNQETAKFLDRKIDKTYHKFKKKFNRLGFKIDYECSIYLKNNQWSTISNILKIEKNKDRIFRNIKIIHKSHIPSSEKMKAYENFEKQLIKTLQIITLLNKIEKTINKKY